MTVRTAGPIGIVGLGLMGTAFAGRLLEADFDVIGYDIAETRSAALRELGGKTASSATEIGRACPIVLLAVVSMIQVENVTNELLTDCTNGIRRRVLLCTSTVQPKRLAELAERVTRRGHILLDTPASGTSRQVAEGNALGLIAGNKRGMETAASVLEAIYPRRRIVGEVGDATKTKLAINLILGLNRLALAEGLVFAERIGLDLETFFAVVRESAAYSQVMDQKGLKMVHGDYEPLSKVSPHLKDVRTMLREAQATGQTLPLATILADVLEACEAQGRGQSDNAIIIEEIRRRRS